MLRSSDNIVGIQYVFTEALQKEFHLLTFFPIKMSFTPQYFKNPENLGVTLLQNSLCNISDSVKEDLSYLPVSIKHVYLNI